jgi:hypothetical protein
LLDVVEQYFEDRAVTPEGCSMQRGLIVSNLHMAFWVCLQLFKNHIYLRNTKVFFRNMASPVQKRGLKHGGMD